MVRPAMTSVRSRETGFALLEAIVAMAIAAIGLATVFRTIGDGLRTASRVQEVQAAIVVARSHLDALGVDGMLASGLSTGVYENNLRWRLNVTDLSSRAGADTRLRPYWITLVAFNRQGASILQLETAKVAREAKP